MQVCFDHTTRIPTVIAVKTTARKLACNLLVLLPAAMGSPPSAQPMELGERPAGTAGDGTASKSIASAEAALEAADLPEVGLKKCAVIFTCSKLPFAH